MATFGELTPFTGTLDDIHREQRQNNWIMAQSMLPRHREAVEAAMLGNAYDRDAALRMQLAQSYADAQRMPPLGKEDLALQRFGQMAPTNRYANAGPAPTPATAPRRMAASSSASSSPVTTGSVNGKEVVVPTAGNYTNNAYSSHLMQLGLGESPTVDAYRKAVEEYRSPQERAMARIAEITNQGKVAAAQAKGQADLQKALLRAGSDVEKQRMDSEKQRLTQYSAAAKALQNPQEAYVEYNKALRSLLPRIPGELGGQSTPATPYIKDKMGKTVPSPEYQQYIATLRAQGLPFKLDEQGNVLPVAFNEWWANAPQVRAQAAMTTKSPGGAEAYRDWANATFAHTLPQPKFTAQQPLQPLQPAQPITQATPSQRQETPAPSQLRPEQVQAMDARLFQEFASGQPLEQVLAKVPPDLQPYVADSYGRWQNAGLRSKQRIVNARRGNPQS